MRARHPTVYPSISKATSAFLLTLSVRKGSELKFRDCLHYVKLLLNVLFPNRRLLPHDIRGVYILVCYWIAVKPDEWEGGEENRSLTEKGKKRARQPAEGLATLDCKPTHLFTSPFVRAYDMASLLRAIVCPAEGRNAGRIGCWSKA
jgi:hypothetical protein